MAHANICAEQALCSNAASVAGKVHFYRLKCYIYISFALIGNLIIKNLQPFFVTNAEPIATWEFMSCMMEAMGCQRSLSLSLSLARARAYRHTHIVKTIQEINMCCGCCSIYRPRINLPAKMLLFASQFSNMIYHRLGLQMPSTPLLYPDTVYFLSRTRTFNTSKARKLLGYNPIVSLEVSLLPYLIVLAIICMLFFLTYVSCCFRNIATKLFL